MPPNITEVDEFTANVPVPDDTEPANHASLLAMSQPLANRTKNLKARVDAAATATTALQAELYSELKALYVGKFYSIGSTFWNPDFWGPTDLGNTSRLAVQSAVTGSGSARTFLQVPITVPDPLPSRLSGLKIKSAGVQIDPVPHSNLPENMPKWTLAYYRPLSGSNAHQAIAAYTDITDDSANTTAYAARHEIEHTEDVALSGLANVGGFIFQFTGETGADSETGLIITAAWVELGY